MFTRQIASRARALAAAIALVCTLIAPAALALVPVPQSSPAEAAAAATAIAPQRAVDEDEQIETRIAGIFSELPALRGVKVVAREGVVTLSGSVASADAKARAEAIAARVSGVVTVENALQRDTSVGGATSGIKKVTARFAQLPALLPLLGAALLVGLAIAAAGYLLAGLGALWRRLTPNVFLAELIASAIRFVFAVGGLVVALNMLGAGALMGAVLGGAGVVGIALGFAMRDTIENYVASLMLSLRQPFRANDHVVIDGHEGRVIRLTSRATVLMTLDGNHLRIPNSAVFKAVILNYTRNPQRRFTIELQIDTKADPRLAQDAGLAALGKLDFVLTQPAPVAVTRDVLYPNVAVQFMAWIDQTHTDFGKARSRALDAVKQALEASGLAIPDPVTHVQMMEANPSAKPRRKPAATPQDTDVAPEPAVAAMVAEERAVTPGDRDLLDPSKPVE